MNALSRMRKQLALVAWTRSLRPGLTVKEYLIKPGRKERVQVTNALGFAFAFLLPLIFTLLWLHLNRQLPLADATDYLSAGFASYRHLTDHGWWYGITHFQLARGWRPIFFSVLSVPFYVVSGGSAFFAYKAVALLAMIASVIYVYLLFRTRLAVWPSAIATNLVCLLPFVQTPILSFFAECALFPCIFGCIYHLIQSDYLKINKHVIGFTACLTLALLVRPVDAALYLILPLSAYLYSGWRARAFPLPQLAAVLAIVLFSIFLLCSFAVAHYVDHGGNADLAFAKTLYHLFIASLVGLVITFGLVLWAKRTTLSSLKHSTLVRSIAIAAAITLIWFLPYAFATLLWIYRTSMGDLAQVYAAAHPVVPAWQVIKMFVQQESVLVMSAVAFTTLFSLFVVRSLDALFASGTNGKRSYLTNPIIQLTLLLPIPLWEVLSTVQSAARKLSIAFPAFIAALLFIALQRGRFIYLRSAIILAVLIAQFVYALNTLYPATINVPQLAQLGGDYPSVVNMQPNPHDVVMGFLNQTAHRYGLRRVDIEANVEKSLPVDVFLLHLHEQLSRQTYTIHYPYFSTYSPLNVQRLSTQTDAVFLTDKRANMQMNETAANAYLQQFVTERNPILKTMYAFLYAYARQQLNTMGWSAGPCLVFKAVDQQDYLGCVLLSKQRELPANNFNGDITV